MLKIDSSFAGLAYSFLELVTTFFQGDEECVARALTDLAELRRSIIEEFPEPAKADKSVDDGHTWLKLFGRLGISTSVIARRPPHC